MSKVLTENQSLLTRYLAAVGCQMDAILYMVAILWETNATLEMLEFCRDNHGASPAQLLSAALKISSKYGRKEI